MATQRPFLTPPPVPGGENGAPKMPVPPRGSKKVTPMGPDLSAKRAAGLIGPEFGTGGVPLPMPPATPNKNAQANPIMGALRRELGVPSAATTALPANGVRYNAVTGRTGATGSGSGFNSLSAGDKRYGAGRSAPNVGATSNKQGYGARDLRNQARKNALSKYLGG